MATSKITYKPHLQTVAIHLDSQEELTTAAPKDNNGDGSKFSPTDLAATSLASCILTVMGIYADQNQHELGEISCELTKIMASNPRRISEINIRLDWKTTLDDQTIERLKRVAINCPVANSLHPDIQQNIEFNISKPN